MPRNEAGCVLCGVKIRDGGSRWMGEFRALYTENQEWTNARLSGIGVRGNLFDYAPRDSSSHHDDPNLDHNALIDIFLLKDNFVTVTLPPYLAPPTESRQTAWGFPFHASCWDLMVKLLDQPELDKQCLFDILMSLPQQHGYINWGHDYGRLLYTEVDDSQLLPGEERVLAGLDYANLLRTPTGTLVHTLDPLYIPELQAIRAKCFRHIDQGPTAQNSALKVSSKLGPFGELPVEIMQMILNFMLSRDVLHLKMASVIVAATPLPESFWATRFDIGQEYEYIFEARDCTLRTFYWRQFYFGVRGIMDNGNLLNRRRIFELIHPLRDLLYGYSLSTCAGTPVQSYFEKGASSSEVSWTSASRALVDPEEDFLSGCRALRIRQIRPPDRITAIFISFVHFNHQRYISGIRFKQDDSVDTCLGYIQHRHESVLDSMGLCDDEQVLHISGFTLAMDLSGLRGLSVSTTGGASNWFGEHEGIPKKRLMIGGGELHLLKAEFDAMKIVSLAVSDTIPTNLHTTPSPAKPPSLLDKAFWLPDVPPPGLLFKDHSSHRPWAVRQQRPYNMLLFGGCRGEHLSQLVQISVWVVDLSRIYGIDLEYTTEVDGRKIHTLGRRGPFSDSEPREEPPYNNSTDKRIAFDIDGPRGERISHVYVQNDAWGKFLSFRLCTNWGREATFPPPSDDTDNDDPFVLVNDAQRVVVGFYALLMTAAVIEILGTISLES